MRYASLFSGIEAASVAWGPLGWEPVAFSEIESFCCRVLEERFPEVPNLGDVAKTDWSEYAGSVDVVVGGSPCQSFSIAGNREGLSGESGLMWEYVRAVRELRPEWLLWENVPGALSSSHGEDFRCLLESLDALGYGLAWRVLDAQFFGVAQRRERVFLVGRLGDPDGPCEVLFERGGMPWDSPSSREKRQELALAARAGAGGGGGRDSAGVLAFDTTQVTSPRNGSNPQFGDPCHTLSAAAHVPVIAFNAGNANDAAVLCMGDATSKASIDEDMCGTLKAHNSKEPPIVAFAANQRGEVRLQGGDGGVCGAIPASQSGKQVQGVLCQYGDVAGALTARGDSSPCADRRPSVVSDGYVVRRLTQRECERLMGFPDDWTKVPYRGKPAEECPDTPRYKAIGNSMAVNVMRWLGVRIDAVDEGENPDEACSRLRGQIFGV